MASDSLVTTISTPQFFYEVQTSNKFDAICRLLDEYNDKSILIFCRTKKDVDHIADKLQLLNYKVAGYHGDLSPAARNKTFQLFVKKQVQALLVTDLPTSFNDLEHIDFVLFSAVPQDPDSYIQRILRLESEIKINEVATLIHSSEFKKIAFIKRVTKSEINERNFIDVDEIIRMKKAQINDEIKRFSDDFESVDKDIIEYANSLLEKYSNQELVSYLLSNGFSRQIVKSSYSNLSAGKKNKSNAVKIENDDLNERLFIAIGKADGIDEDRLIEFLSKETNISNELFSQIKLFDTFSFFVVPNEEADIILEIFRRKKRGKRSIVERAKGKDSKKKN